MFIQHICIEQHSINNFGLKALKTVSLFHGYTNSHIVAFMKNRSDFFILFPFCQKFNIIIEFVATSPSIEIQIIRLITPMLLNKDYFLIKLFFIQIIDIDI